MASLKLSEYRPCIVKRRRAIFHRWVEKEDLIFDFKLNVKAGTHIMLKDSFLAEKYVPEGVDVMKVKNTYGLVEYPSGKIILVEPTDIKFLDSEKLAYEISFQEDKND